MDDQDDEIPMNHTPNNQYEGDEEDSSISAIEHDLFHEVLSVYNDEGILSIPSPKAVNEILIQFQEAIESITEANQPATLKSVLTTMLGADKASSITIPSSQIEIISASTLVARIRRLKRSTLHLFFLIERLLPDISYQRYIETKILEAYAFYDVILARTSLSFSDEERAATATAPIANEFLKAHTRVYKSKEFNDL